MYQQHSFRWLDILLAPRVGIAALAFGMAAAFVAGAILVLLLVGRAGTPLAIASSVGAPAHGSAGNVADFGTAPQAPVAVNAAPAAVKAPPARLASTNVADFGTAPRSGTSAAVPARVASTNVADFGTAPHATTVAALPATPAHASTLNVADFGTAPRADGSAAGSAVRGPGYNVGDFGTSPHGNT